MAICRNPYIPPSQIPAPCGKCPECLVNRRALWTLRNILESYEHDKSCFITLTYDDDHLPTNEDGVPTLVPEHLSTFIKNLRSKIDDKIRYYGVGEYGTSGEGRGEHQLPINPHLHLLLYGIGEEKYDQILSSWTKSKGRGRRDQTPMGLIDVGELTPKSAAYVCGYVEKKNDYNKDMYEDLNIYPEFSRMSNRPGIGATHVSKIAKAMEKYPQQFLLQSGDVPISYKVGNRTYPLGQYLRERLRHELNLDRDEITEYDQYTGELTTKVKWHAKEKQKEIYKKDLQDMQKNTQNDPKLTKDAKASLKHLMEYNNVQHTKNFDSRRRTIKKKHSL